MGRARDARAGRRGGDGRASGRRSISSAITVAARPADVFDVLSDPKSYAAWVFGTEKVRNQDSDWPRPGAHFDHVIGFPPLGVRDRTTVDRFEPRKRLVLTARWRPGGVAKVAVCARRKGRRTEVTMEEWPESGPMRWLWLPVFRPAMAFRNWRSLKRLRQMAEDHAQGRTSLFSRVRRLARIRHRW